MTTKKYNWINKPIFWGLLIFLFDLFYAFWFFVNASFFDANHTQYIYTIHSADNSFVSLWFFLNYPIRIYTGFLFTNIVYAGPHASPFVFLLYYLIIAILAFFVVYIFCHIIKAAKKHNWFDRPIFFGLLFPVHEFFRIFYIIGVTIIFNNDPHKRELYRHAADTEWSFFDSFISWLLGIALLFIIGYIFGYIVKIVRKKFFAPKTGKSETEHP